MAPAWVLCCIAVGVALQVPAGIMAHIYHRKRMEMGRALGAIRNQEVEDGLYRQGSRQMWLNRARATDRHWTGEVGLWIHILGLTFVVIPILIWFYQRGVFR
jgi:hypothetical protein